MPFFACGCCSSAQAAHFAPSWGPLRCPAGGCSPGHTPWHFGGAVLLTSLNHDISRKTHPCSEGRVNVLACPCQGQAELAVAKEGVAAGCWGLCLAFG